MLPTPARPRGPSGATHLAYKLEVPLEPGPAQRLFRVERELVVAIKARGRGWGGGHACCLAVCCELQGALQTRGAG